MNEKNVIDKPLMTTLQWLWVLAGVVAGTNTVNLVISRLEKVEIAQEVNVIQHEKDIKAQSSLHIKDFEILLHKISAKGGRTDEDMKTLWEELNKLKENHDTVD